MVELDKTTAKNVGVDNAFLRCWCNSAKKIYGIIEHFLNKVRGNVSKISTATTIPGGDFLYTAEMITQYPSASNVL
jgi:hypothetical protein